MNSVSFEFGPIIAWVSPILSTVIVTFLTASIKVRMDEAERRREEARAETEEERRERREWRESVDRQLEKLANDNKLALEGQCSQMRSDIIHKCHRYLDDLGKASVEEKQSLNASYDDYLKLCEALEIENHFVDNLVKRTMALPERDI